MDVKCPHCGTEYEIEQREFGKFVDCQVCGKGFVVGVSAAKQNATPSRTVCPHCRTEYEVEQQEIGRATKCEVCGNVFVVRATTPIANRQAERMSKVLQLLDNEDQANSRKSATVAIVAASVIIGSIGAYLFVPAIIRTGSKVGRYIDQHADVVIDGVKISKPLGMSYEKLDDVYSASVYSKQNILPDEINIQSYKEKWPMRDVTDYANGFVDFCIRNGNRARVLSSDNVIAYIEHSTHKSKLRCYKKIIRDEANERFVLISAYYNEGSPNERELRKCVQGARLSK